MTNVFAVHSVGQSLVDFLKNSYPADLRTSTPCDFALISSGELAADEELDPRLTLYLYRVTLDEHLRSATRSGRPGDEETPLSLNLHYLLSVWAKSATTEHTVLAWAMHHLKRHPVLDGSSLSPEAQWNAGETIHVIPAELSTDDMMRIWDALEPSYRLSVSYIARVVRIDGDRAPDSKPVVATRFTLRDRVGENTATEESP